MSGFRGAHYIAKGHYAQTVRLDSGRFTVKQAVHAEKDQTYMLYRLTQEQLSRTLMPLGRVTASSAEQFSKQ